ncbi:MAG: site-specific DNA-methyltransferase [Elusimicrobiales bacterium]|nr:site-specific DNA-methyltransferase [Elusimicrobiales bacterium]
MKPFEEKASADIVGENVAKLKTIFPEAFAEGKIDFEVLKQVLGGMVDEREEKYGLNWHGKRRARQIALTPSTGTLRPCPKDSVDWDTTKNLMIEGDNLEVLKLLQKSYAGKVKLIYIDPPYNTGNDFVYPDDFTDNIKNYQELTGQIDSEGNKLSANTESSGRFHTDWLNMMYPRLKLARNLLKDDGVIFISIDDREIPNLRKICDDIFGEENFVTDFIWEKRTNRENRKVVSARHDNLVCYCKDAAMIPQAVRQLPMSEKALANYKNPDNDPRGAWKSDPATAQAGHGTKSQFYSFTAPNGTVHELESGRCWLFTKSVMEQAAKDGRLWFGRDGNGVPRLKTYLDAKERGLTPETIWFAEDVGTNETAKNALKELFDERSVFDTPKPVDLIRQTILLSAENGIVLDFFAGAGTTGHAVFDQNYHDNGNRRFILVQLPELCPAGSEAIGIGLKTIADITKERLRRAAKKIHDETPLFKGDLGFRVFKLDSTNIREWDPDRNNLEQSVQLSIDHLKADRTEDDILYELLLKLGLDLAIPLEQKAIAGKTVYSIGAGTLISCLATAISAKEVEPLAHGIIAWHKALAPAGDTTIVFRDSAFADDIAKTNLTAILDQHEILEQASSKHDKKFRFIVRSI